LNNNLKSCIFCKTWANDIKWLRYCLSFLAKNWQEENSEIVVLADDNCRSTLATMPYAEREHIIFYKPWPDGYTNAMWCKTNADNFTNADIIIFFDSDTMLVEPAVLETFLSDGKPLMQYQPYDEFLVKYPQAPWKRIQQNLMGLPAKYYFTFLPFVCWRDTLRQTRVWVSRKHRWASETIAYSDKPFAPETFRTHPIRWADHELIGAYAWQFEQDKYNFVRYKDDEPVVPWKVRQYHSWSQWSAQTEAELKKMLPPKDWTLVKE
jgi:hypothetical protein